MRGGYALANHNGKPSILHNVTVEMAGLPRPPGLKADHLCNRPPCINPHHIEYVTQRENVLRGFRRGRKPSGVAAIAAAKTHCSKGHEFTPENTIIAKSGQRRCRVCHNLETKLAKRRKRARE